MGTCTVSSLEGGQITLEADEVVALQGRLRGPLIWPEDPTYDEVRGLWNGMMDKRPAIIVRALGLADVIEVVGFARHHGLFLAVRGGGHNVAGNGSCDGGMLLDLSLMRGISVDPDTERAVVQGGATLGDMDRECQVFGLAVPAGVVSSTGVGGLTLGGGTGWQLRKYGLSIDNLISAQVVTADGHCQVASADHNPDLFWGIRGGGGNFGVVTSFTFQAHRVGPEVYLCCPMYSAELGELSLRKWRDFMRDAPPECGASFLFWSIPPHPFFPAALHGRPVAIPLVVYVGDVAAGSQILEPLRQLGTPLVDLSGPMAWTDLQTMFDPFVPKRQLQYYWKCLYLNHLDDGLVQDLTRRAAGIPSPNTYLVIMPFGGRMAQIGADDTAFGPRNMPYLLELDSMWRDADQSERNITWTRQMWEDLQPQSTGGLYVNFPGLGEEKAELVKKAVGTRNFERLTMLKQKWDPDNFFRGNLNIPPR